MSPCISWALNDIQNNSEVGLTEGFLDEARLTFSAHLLSAFKTSKNILHPVQPFEAFLSLINSHDNYFKAP